MNVFLVTPVPPGSLQGNRITADRWAHFLRSLGHPVTIATGYHDQPADVLVALHARKSHAAMVRFHEVHPERPILLALTGTDVYDDIHNSSEARQSLELATRLVVLQSRAIDEIPPHLRERARVIHQSVEPLEFQEQPRRDVFEVCVMGHLRPVKDPFRTAQAARLLPASSRIQVLHLGTALSEEMKQAALAEQASNPRYHWLEARERPEALAILSRCRLLVLTSRLEGGANVIGEAVTLGVPVLSSRISGSLGLLGDDYPGFFPFGDTAALATLLRRAESEPEFYQDLRHRCERLRSLFEPQRERESWRQLLDEVR